MGFTRALSPPVSQVLLTLVSDCKHHLHGQGVSVQAGCKEGRSRGYLSRTSEDHCRKIALSRRGSAVYKVKYLLRSVPDLTSVAIRFLLAITFYVLRLTFVHMKCLETLIDSCSAQTNPVTRKPPGGCNIRLGALTSTYLVPLSLAISLKMVIFSSLKVKQITLFPRIKAAALRIN